jgi:lysophospholipase L1-like esterase
MLRPVYDIVKRLCMLAMCLSFATCIISAVSWDAVNASGQNWFDGVLAHQYTSANDISDDCSTESWYIKTDPFFRYEQKDYSLQSVCVYHSEDFSYALYRRQYASQGLDNWQYESGIAVATKARAGDRTLIPVDYVYAAYGMPHGVLGNNRKFIIHVGTPGYSSAMEVRIIDNFTDHISLNGSQTRYVFDTTTYDWLQGKIVGSYINGFGASHNGRWLVVINAGRLLRINQESGRVDVVANKNFNESWMWPEPAHDLFISNDGTTLGYVSRNDSSAIFQVDDSCINTAMAPYSYTDLTIYTNCKHRVLTEYMNQFSEAMSENSGGIRWFLKPMVSGDNTVLTYSDSHGVVHSVSYIEFARPDNIDYLALGDSFSSGEGDLTGDYLPHTNVYGDYANSIPREMCHISRGSYPFLLAREMGLANGIGMQSVACSGATMPDMLSTEFSQQAYINPLYEGQQTQRIAGDSSRLGGLANMDELKQEARTSYIPGRVQQIEYVRATQPKVMTITMGGNDFGFGSIMASCASSMRFARADQTCSDLLPDGRLENVQKIYSTYPRLREMYKAIKNQYITPSPRIFVIGYPKFFDESVYCADMLSLYTQTEQRAIGELIDYANATIRQAATDEGLTFIDVSNALKGSEMCGASNSLTTVDDLLIKGIYTEYMKYKESVDANIRQYGHMVGGMVNQSPGFISAYLALRITDGVGNYIDSPSAAIDGTLQQLAHPNKTGHLAIAQTMYSGLGAGLLYSDECNTVVICADGVVLGHAPDPSLYVGGVSLDEAQGKIVMNGAGVVSVGSKLDDKIFHTLLPVLRKATKDIVVGVSKDYLDAADFQYTTPPRLVMQSNPIDLGSLALSPDTNRYEIVFDVPNVPVGYHALRIMGYTSSGRTIDIVQRIFVEGPANDIDDDGIPDGNDTCAFGTPRGRDIDADRIDDDCDLGSVVHQAQGGLPGRKDAKDVLGNGMQVDVAPYIAVAPVVDSPLLRGTGMGARVTSSESPQTNWPLWAVVLAGVLALAVLSYGAYRRRARG